MKTKNKILLFTSIIPFILILMIILSIKKSFNEDTDPSQLNLERIDTVTRSFDFHGFENIVLEGYWDIDIKHDDYFSVELIAPEKLLAEITVGQTGQTVHFFAKKNSFPVLSLIKCPRIFITLPVMSKLNLKGIADISFSDFNNAKTSISTDGVMNVTGENCTFDQFSLNGSGVMNVSMKEVPVTNVHLDYRGIYNGTMLMNGGSLTGYLDGIGSIEVSGEISKNTLFVKESGRLKVTH